MKNKMSIERKIELEDLAISCESVKTNELIHYLIDQNYNYAEIMYVFHTLLLPKQAIEKDIERYDNTLGIDELKFVDELKVKYNVTSEIVINRIQEVRAINKYKAQAKRLQKLRGYYE